MKEQKTEILRNLCYTELVYSRINKKLHNHYSKDQIEKMLFDIIEKTDVGFFKKNGKNFYISNEENNIRITVNSNTYRIITVDLLSKMNKA